MKPRRTVRLKDYDYSQPGGYFVTICTNKKSPLFGTLIDREIELNVLGKEVKHLWQDLPEKYPTTSVDEFIVMPDHLHGILIFNNEHVGAGSPCPSSNVAVMLKESGRRNDAPTLGNVVGYFKYQCAKQVNLIRNTPGAPVWQRNYYEHVIRSEEDLTNIRKYIKYNPQKIMY